MRALKTDINPFRLKWLTGAIWLATLMILVAPLNAGPIFNAFVDKTTIENQEPLILTLEYLGKTHEEPNLVALENDFIIISRQSSTESHMVNGNFSAKTSWILQIYPKTKAKEVVIPSINLGGSNTSPITIYQVEKKEKQKSDATSLTVTADKTKVYVHGEVLVNVEVKTALSIKRGTITKLQLDDAIIEPLGEEEVRDSIENGIRHIIIRKSYAIFPSKVGKLTIPSFVFRGVAAPLQGSRRDFFGSFFAGQEIFARSDELNLEIMDIPESFPKDKPFLPVRSFVVVESLDKPDDEIEVGKAITRRFEMKAKGTLPSFLPNIAPTPVKDLQTYTEDGHKSQKTLSDGILATSEFSHVYMPTAGGKITIPEEVIYWWDTESDKLKTTIIRSMDLQVAPSNQAFIEPTPSQSLIDLNKKNIPSPWWLIIMLGCTIAGVLLVFVMFVRRLSTRIRVASKNLALSHQLNEHLKGITLACNSHDPKLAYHRMVLLRALLRQHKLSRSENELNTLLTNLEIALFNKGQSETLRHDLKELKKKLLLLSLEKTRPSSLLPLYPH